MDILIGMDEAGYGPNLGPLAVAVTVWRVGEERSEVGDRGSEDGPLDSQGGNQLLAAAGRQRRNTVDLYQRLSQVVSRTVDDDRLAIADSKRLYKPAQGLRLLERGVLASLAAVGGDGGTAVGGDATARWQTLLETTRADPGHRRSALPWYAHYDCALPIAAEVAELSRLAAKFRDGCRAAAVELVDIRARLVFPREFNQQTEHHGSKGAALSHLSIGLLKNTLAGLPIDDRPLPTFITCDKHGGRNRYGALLQHHFPDTWIETIHESRAASHYQWGPPRSCCEICFRTGGESFLPTALASMVAKYQRELAMRAFNAFWQKHVPDLRPTAGYPVDAKRFQAEIAPRQRQLGIAEADLWRRR